jgi:hypothetical protein
MPPFCGAQKSFGWDKPVNGKLLPVASVHWMLTRLLV